MAKARKAKHKARSSTRPIGAGRSGSTWVARQVPGHRVKDVKVGARLELKACREVTLGHRVLIASQDRSKLAGLAVVLGEPVKPKGAQYIRTALVTHSFDATGTRLARRLGEKQGARVAEKRELRTALEEAARQATRFSFVFEAASQVANQLSDGPTSERDSEELLVAMIRAAGYENVGRQMSMPGPSDPSDGKKKRRPLRADVVANVKRGSASAKKPELLVIEGEWTGTGGAESAAQAYEYSRRIMGEGKLANGVALLGLGPRAVKNARVHALVVANKLLDGCMTAEKLQVELMDYFDFAEHLRAKDFSSLRTLS